MYVVHDNSPKYYIKYYCTAQTNSDQADVQTPHMKISARPHHSASIKEISTSIVNNKTNVITAPVGLLYNYCSCRVVQYNIKV